MLQSSKQVQCTSHKHLWKSNCHNIGLVNNLAANGCGFRCQVHQPFQWINLLKTSRPIWQISIRDRLSTISLMLGHWERTQVSIPSNCRCKHMDIKLNIVIDFPEGEKVLDASLSPVASILEPYSILTLQIKAYTNVSLMWFIPPKCFKWGMETLEELECSMKPECLSSKCSNVG